MRELLLTLLRTGQRAANGLALPRLCRKSPPVPVIDHLLALGPIRKAVWRWWYPFLTRRLQRERVHFLNYAYEEKPPLAIPLGPENEPDRACIQLYHHVAAQAPLHGKEVLEVSCGHGGGAAYLVRTLRPQRYVALDLNPAAIRFCQQQHRLEGLVFQQGDAGHLPFGQETFHSVINVEASHCYPNFPRFLSEVARVLRPGGNFLYADFRFALGVAGWEQALAATPLHIQHIRNISAEVRRGMAMNSPRSLELVTRHLPKFLRPLGCDFAGTKGSRLYDALAQGNLIYRSYLLRKPGAEDGV